MKYKLTGKCREMMAVRHTREIPLVRWVGGEGGATKGWVGMVILAS